MSKDTLHSIIIEDTSWQYYDIGSGDRVLVIFLNILVFPESWEFYIKQLSKKYRIIIPIYPEIADYQVMVKQLQSLLKELRVKKMTLLGNSLGGMIAQVYAYNYPKQVEKLILLATIAPNKLYGFLASILYRMGQVSPAFLVTYAVWIGAWISLSRYSYKENQIAKLLLKHILRRSTKQYILSLGKCILDFCFEFQNTLSPNVSLITIEGQGDIVFPSFARNLKSVYPTAFFYKIESGKHLVEINKKEEISKILLKELTYN